MEQALELAQQKPESGKWRIYWYSDDAAVGGNPRRESDMTAYEIGTVLVGIAKRRSVEPGKYCGREVFVMAWITAIDSNRRDDRGRPVKHYRVEWYEIARDGDGKPIPRYENRVDGPAKMVRRQETFDTREAAQARVDEINPKIARGQSPATQREAGNRPLSHYAQAWLDGLTGQIKPRVLGDYRANYRRYVAEPLGNKAVASITAADVRRWRAQLMEPRPRPAHARPKGTTDADAELVTLSRSTVTHAFTTLRRILDVAVIDGAITANPCVSVPRTRPTDPDAKPFRPGR
jgi:integrase